MSRRVQHPTNLFYARADPMPPLYPFPARGDVYYNLDLQVLRMWTGTQWETVSSVTSPLTVGDGVMLGDAGSGTYTFTETPSLVSVTTEGSILQDDPVTPSGQQVSFAGSVFAPSPAINPAVLLLFPVGWEGVVGDTMVRASLELGNIDASCTAVITAKKVDAGWQGSYSSLWSDNVIQDVILYIGNPVPGGDTPGGYLDTPIVSDGKLITMSDGRLGMLFVFSSLVANIVAGDVPYTATISYGGTLSSLLEDVTAYSVAISGNPPSGYSTSTSVSKVRTVKGELVTRNHIADGAVTDDKLNATSGGYGTHTVTWSGGAGYGESFSACTDLSTGGGGAIETVGAYNYPQSPGFWLVSVGSWFSGLTFPHSSRIFMGIAAAIDGVIDYRRFSLGPTESAVGGSALFHFPNVNSNNWWSIKGYQDNTAGSVTMSGEWTAKWLGHAI